MPRRKPQFLRSTWAAPKIRKRDPLRDRASPERVDRVLIQPLQRPEFYCVAARPEGITMVWLRFGTCPTAILATSFIDGMSTTNVLFPTGSAT